MTRGATLPIAAIAFLVSWRSLRCLFPACHLLSLDHLCATMMDSTVDDEDFPPNPFRSGGQAQPQPQQPPPLQRMMPPQQQQAPQEYEDFFTNPALTAVDPLGTPAPMDHNTMNKSTTTTTTGHVIVNTSGTMPAPAPTSWWQSCRACCTIHTYQQFFDIDTVDISTRLKASIVHFYQPDYFRTNIIGVERNDQVKGPDLYGPFWVTMTVVFLIAVSLYIYIYI